MTIADILPLLDEEEPITIFSELKCGFNKANEFKCEFYKTAEELEGQILNSKIKRLYTDDCIYGICIDIENYIGGKNND